MKEIKNLELISFEKHHKNKNDKKKNELEYSL